MRKSFNENRFLAYEKIVDSADRFDVHADTYKKEDSLKRGRVDDTMGRSDQSAMALLKSSIPSIKILGCEGAYADLEQDSRRVLEHGDPRLGETIRRVYSGVWKTGRVFREAQAIHCTPRELRATDLSCPSLRTSDYYDSLLELGTHKFGKTVIGEPAARLEFEVNYPCVSALNANAVDYCATGNITTGISTVLHTPGEVEDRLAVSLSQSVPRKVSYKTDFNNLLNEGFASKEKVARGLGFDKKDCSDVDVTKLQRIFSKIHGSSRITRFMKLWGYYIWASEAGEAVDVNVPARLKICEYTPKDMVAIAESLLSGPQEGTVIWAETDGLSDAEFLSLACTEFPAFENQSRLQACIKLQARGSAGGHSPPD